MGETAQLNGPLAGQFGLNDFLAQRNNAATPQRMVRAILPVQEMRDFQRRYFFDTDTRTLFLGERISLLRWTVPAGEHWRPLSLFYGHTDSITHSVITTFSMNKRTTGVVYIPVRTTVVSGNAKVIYGADADGSMQGGISAADEYRSRIPVTMEPGDVFDFIDETDAAGATVARWVFVYERVPAPATKRVPGVVGAVTVVP